MPTCLHCVAETPDEYYRRVVYNETALFGPWRSWRVAGRELVSPGGHRITPYRLRGILFVETHQSKRHFEDMLTALPRR